MQRRKEKKNRTECVTHSKYIQSKREGGERQREKDRIDVSFSHPIKHMLEKNDNSTEMGMGSE